LHLRTSPRHQAAPPTEVSLAPLRSYLPVLPREQALPLARAVITALLELHPRARLVLDLLDHVTAFADDNSDRRLRDQDLEHTPLLHTPAPPTLRLKFLPFQSFRRLA